MRGGGPLNYQRPDQMATSGGCQCEDSLPGVELVRQSRHFGRKVETTAQNEESRRNASSVT